MELLKQIKDQALSYQQYADLFFQDLKEAEENHKKIARLGLYEQGMEFEPQDTSKFGKPQAIKSASGRQAETSRRPNVPLPEDLYFDPATKKLRVITNRHRDHISGRDFKSNEKDLVKADPSVIADVVAKIRRMGQDEMAEKVASKVIWVPRETLSVRAPRPEQGGERVIKREVPAAPDWELA